MQLQKQHLALTKDVQHWQGKYTSSKVEVDRLFQQLQQVVALSAVFNPTILEALERTPASSDCTQVSYCPVKRSAAWCFWKEEAERLVILSL